MKNAHQNMFGFLEINIFATNAQKHSYKSFNSILIIALHMGLFQAQRDGEMGEEWEYYILWTVTSITNDIRYTSQTQQNLLLSTRSSE